MANTTNVPTPTFTPTGLILPQEAAILAGVQQDYNAAFGGNLNPQLTSPQGQLCSSTAAIIANANTIFATFVNQIDPDTATGFMQDAIGRIYFLDRNPAVPTVVNVLCTGAFETPIPVGALAKDTSGNIYSCTEAGTIPVGGSITLPFANVVPGPTACPANTVTTIYQAIDGWESVNNSSPGVIGANVESPAAFEYRREQSVGKNAQGSIPAIYAACFGVPNVIDVFVTQNNTGATISSAINGNPNSTSYPVAPHSIYIAVTGGAAQAVANAIWAATNIGAAYQPIFSGTGSQSASVVTISANPGGASVSRIEVGMTLAGAVGAGTVVTSFGTYTNTTGTGTLNVTTSGTHASGAITGQQIGSAGATLVSETVQDNSGYNPPYPEYQVNYINPVSTPIYFAVSLAASTLLPANIVTLVQQAIIAQFTGQTQGSIRERIGSQILASRYFGPIQAIGNEVSILTITIGFNSSVGDASLQMGIDQEPTISATNIAVTT
jgi:Baseplate J-like protein